MAVLYTSHSLCHICFRHIPSQITVENNIRYINKECPEHGYFKIIQDPDAEFCEKLEQKTNKIYQNILMLETTDKCNLNCPHCYHIPKNDVTDLSILKVYDEIKNAPKELNKIILAGAEPTVRKEIFDLIDYCNQNGRKPSILTNGVKLSERKFVENLIMHKTEAVLIGLNHWSYQGKKIHQKQLKGIKNCIDLNLFFYYIGYTVESYEHLKDVLEEIQNFPYYNKGKKYQFRIRLGSNIGRVPNEPTAYISKNYKEIEKIAKSLGQELISGHEEGDDNMYHMFGYINGHKIRIIQWPDATNIDLSQLKHSPWAKFNRQNYITNFIHQVITRDAYVNKKIPVLDSVPDEYKYSIKNDGDIK
jgi:organic radical activating enzyme